MVLEGDVIHLEEKMGQKTEWNTYKIKFNPIEQNTLFKLYASYHCFNFLIFFSAF